MLLDCLSVLANVLSPEAGKLLWNLLRSDLLHPEDENTSEDDAEDVDESEDEADQAHVERLHGQVVVVVTGRVALHREVGVIFLLRAIVKEHIVTLLRYFHDKGCRPEDAAVDGGWKEGGGDGDADEAASVAAEDGEGDAGAAGDGDEDADPEGTPLSTTDHLLCWPLVTTCVMFSFEQRNKDAN